MSFLSCRDLDREGFRSSGCEADVEAVFRCMRKAWRDTASNTPSFSSTRTSRWSADYLSPDDSLTPLQLMQEANVRLLELRHTLPNLKSLLLTLSSPVPPPSLPPPSIPGSSTYMDSQASSRQASRAWSIPALHGSPSSSTGRETPLNGLDTPSPMRKVGRSRLSRPSAGRDVNVNDEGEGHDRDPEKVDGESELHVVDQRNLRHIAL